MSPAGLAPHSNHSSVPASDPAERLSQLWRQGRRPDVAAFLADAGTLGPTQAAAVLRVDQGQRWQARGRVPAEAYLRQYPAVAADPDAAVDLVFREFPALSSPGRCGAASPGGPVAAEPA
jgi:hypothetical protein